MGDEPEIWIDDRPGTDGPQRAPDPGPDSGSGRGRWIALAAGFVALLALIAVQHFAGSTPDSDTAPTPSVSETPPPASSSPTHAPESTSLTATDGSTAFETAVGRGDVAAARSRTAEIVASVNPMPSTGTTTPVGLPGAPFELVGLQWNGAMSTAPAVVRYRSDTGATVRTEVSSLIGNGPLSFIVTDDATVIRPSNGFPLVMPDDKPAVHAGGLLSYAGRAFPTADPHQVWATGLDYRGMLTLQLTDPLTGDAAGQTITLPMSVTNPGPDALTPDGAGYLLLRMAGGVYDLTPGGAELVTHGEMLAAGPTGYLVYECDDSAQCSAAVVDRATGSHMTLDGYAPSAPTASGQIQGVISRDGRYAALIGRSTGGPPLGIIDLHADTARPILLPLAGVPSDASSMLAFTPDSQHLIVISGDYTRVVDPATGEVLGELPVPPLMALAIRPLG